jgi:hypothetical protein
MYNLAANVLPDYGKVIADGLAKDLLVPFFLGAIHYSQEDIVKYIATTKKLPQTPTFLAALKRECDNLQNFEPEMIGWIRAKLLRRDTP